MTTAFKDYNSILATYESDEENFPGKKKKDRQRKKKVDAILNKNVNTDSRTAMKNAGIRIFPVKKKVTAADKKKFREEDEYNDMIADALEDSDIPASKALTKSNPNSVRVLGKVLENQNAMFQKFMQSNGDSFTPSFVSVSNKRDTTDYDKFKVKNKKGKNNDDYSLDNRPHNTFSEKLRDSKKVKIKLNENRKTANNFHDVTPSNDQSNKIKEEERKNEHTVTSNTDSSISDIANVVSLLQKLSGNSSHNGMDILAIVQTVLSHKKGKIESDDHSDSDEHLEKQKKNLKSERRSATTSRKYKPVNSDSDSEYEPKSRKSSSEKQISRKNKKPMRYEYNSEPESESESESGSDYEYEMFKAMKKFKKYQALRHQKLLTSSEYDKSKKKYSSRAEKYKSSDYNSDFELETKKQRLKEKMKREKMLLEKEKKKLQKKKHKAKLYSSDDDSDFKYQRSKVREQKKKKERKEYERMKDDYRKMQQKGSTFTVEEPSDTDEPQVAPQKMLTYETSDSSLEQLNIDAKNVKKPKNNVIYSDSEDEYTNKKKPKKKSKYNPLDSDSSESGSNSYIDYQRRKKFSKLRPKQKPKPKPNPIVSDSESDSDGYIAKNKLDNKRNSVHSDSDIEASYAPKVKKQSSIREDTKVKPNPMYSDSNSDSEFDYNTKFKTKYKSSFSRHTPELGSDSGSDSDYKPKPKAKEKGKNVKREPMESRPNPIHYDSDSDFEYTSKPKSKAKRYSISDSASDSGSGYKPKAKKNVKPNPIDSDYDSDLEYDYKPKSKKRYDSDSGSYPKERHISDSESGSDYRAKTRGNYKTASKVKPNPINSYSEFESDNDYSFKATAKSKGSRKALGSDSDSYYLSKSKPRSKPKPKYHSDTESESESDYSPKVKSNSKMKPNPMDSDSDFEYNSKQKSVKRYDSDSGSYPREHHLSDSISSLETNKNAKHKSTSKVNPFDSVDSDSEVDYRPSKKSFTSKKSNKKKKKKRVVEYSG